jgi:hypothetical protein
MPLAVAVILWVTACTAVLGVLGYLIDLTARRHERDEGR